MSEAGAKSRPRLAVAITYPIDPPLGGGQVRAYNLYRGLSEVFDVEMVTLAGADVPQRRRELAPGLVEHRIPKSAEHAARELELERGAGTVVTDVAMTELFETTPAYLQALAEASQGARAVVACHPYTFPAIRAVSDGPLWYEAQDVEASLKRHVLGDSPEALRLRDRAEEVERVCCEDAELVWACSEEDRQELVARYDIPAERVLVVPNGAALDALRYVGPDERRRLRERLRLGEATIGLFIASWHGPNLLAAQRLVRLARDEPELQVLIVGSLGLALANEILPGNVQVMGTVTAAFKETILGVADVALNPVTTGSGTNIKMLDYFGAGIPVISTAFGARGLGVRPGEHFISAEPPEFGPAIGRLRDLPEDDLDRMVSSARSFVTRRLAWSVIARELIEALREREPVAADAGG